MQLGDDALAQLWSLYDASGIRPEYVLPVLYFESGFDPSLPNRQGAPYYGIGQDSAASIERAGYTVAQYLALGAGEQLRAVVVPRLVGLVHQFGPLRSATRVYQGNFLPGTLGRARDLWQPLVAKGSPFYAPNAFDWQGKGAIVVADLARAMARSARSGEVQDAIDRAYAMRPSEEPREAVFGEDFALDPWPALILLAAAAAGALLR